MRESAVRAYIIGILAFRRRRLRFGAAFFAVRRVLRFARFFARFAIVRLFLAGAPVLVRFLTAFRFAFFLGAAGVAGEGVGIVGEGVGIVAIDSLGLIPNRPTIGLVGPLLSVLDIHASESNSRRAQDRAMSRNLATENARAAVKACVDDAPWSHSRAHVAAQYAFPQG